MRLFSRLKAIDFYKKLPSDLTEATLAGAWISIVASIAMAFLFGMEFYSFMSVTTRTELIVDRSPPTDLLKINFNISFPALSCEFATLDVSDALGTKRLNLTKTVRKVPITLDLERVGAATDDDNHKPTPKYDDEGRFDDEEDIDITQPLTSENFKMTLGRYPIVIVNFFAPWCHWCQRLEPTWEAATKEIHERYPEGDGRIRLAKVDCTADVELCREHLIQGFPSIRVFRKGSDDIVVGGNHEHEAYNGDRTKEALVGFAESLVPSAGLPHRKHQDLVSAPTSAGCNMAGFALVKKVPGSLQFAARSDGHSFDHGWMNMTHVVHSFYFGNRPTVKKYYQLQGASGSPARSGGGGGGGKGGDEGGVDEEVEELERLAEQAGAHKSSMSLATLQRLHPAGLAPDWADKLHDKMYVSEHAQSTHEHYMQVVLTTVEPQDGRKGSAYDAYEYTAHSHTFMSDQVPSVRLTYDMSPIQILVKEVSKPWYHFVTTTCAIIGGVFTVAGILDAILYQSMKIVRKVNLGKQT